MFVSYIKNICDFIFNFAFSFQQQSCHSSTNLFNFFRFCHSIARFFIANFLLFPFLNRLWKGYKETCFVSWLIISVVAARQTERCFAFCLSFWFITLTLQFFFLVIKNDNGKMWKRHNLNTIFHLFVMLKSVYPFFRHWWLNVSEKRRKKKSRKGEVIIKENKLCMSLIIFINISQWTPRKRSSNTVAFWWLMNLKNFLRHFIKRH